MRFGRRMITFMVLGMLLTTIMTVGSAGAWAQGATPEATPIDVDTVAPAARPAHIHAGSCPEVGDIVAPLNELTAATGGVTAVGAEPSFETDAVAAEYSFTTISLTLEEIVTGDYAINVHESAESIDNYIACGDLDGVIDDNGTLVVGLRELNDSGYTGIAVLSPSTTEGNTDVSVFIARGLSDDPLSGRT